MKPFRLGQWGLHILPLGSRCPCPLSQRSVHYSIRFLSSTPAIQPTNTEPIKRKRGRPRKNPLTPLKSSAAVAAPRQHEPEPTPEPPLQDSEHLQTSSLEDVQEPPFENKSEFDANSQLPESVALENLPSPPIDAAQSSAKLAALHARLSLPSDLPLNSLARALVDKSADGDPRFNNASLARLGNDLLGFYMAEHLVCQHPRLPMAVVFAAQQAYVGPHALNAVVKDWGVEAAAHPGGEVDPGLLQFRWAPPGTEKRGPGQSKQTPSQKLPYKGGLSSSITKNDQFGHPKPQAFEDDLAPANTQANESEDVIPEEDTAVLTATLTSASADFMRAIVATLFLHDGAIKAYNFFSDHIISRHLDIGGLFTFQQPTRDLSRLCAREGFASPVARLISETGRLSSTPVFVVGVFSGRDKLGEGAGSSLNEARFKAAVHALKGWYLYSPAVQQPVPSIMEGERGKGRTWKPALIDQGEVIV